jgi:hypothetical protein
MLTYCAKLLIDVLEPNLCLWCPVCSLPALLISTRASKGIKLVKGTYAAGFDANTLKLLLSALFLVKRMLIDVHLYN